MALKQKLLPTFQFARLTVILFFLCRIAVFAEDESRFVITADSFKNNKVVELDELRWKFKAGDDLAWAALDFNDATWKTITNDEINADAAKALGDWNGRAWFRLSIEIDESIINQPLAFRVWHWGASEIYLDGRLIQSFGAIEANRDVEFNPRGVFFPVTFANAGKHEIAVRYSFKAASEVSGGGGKWLVDGGYLPGFRFVVEPGNDAAFKLAKQIGGNWLDYVIAGLLSALALVHLLLFVFYPRQRGNLYYSFFVAGIAATILLNRVINNWNSAATTFALLDIARQATQAAAVMSLLSFLYFEFTEKRSVSRFFWILTGLWIACLIAIIARVSLPFPLYLCLLLTTLAASVRIIWQSLVRRQPGAWNIAAGVAVLVVGVLINISFERELISLPEGLHQVNLYIAILSVPLAVSIYLGRSFARTNQNLEQQLIKEIEHEKERARLKIVEAENERRAEELEEARQLQLSLLPKKLPQIAHLDIAAYMKPATEVGGDYYDFHVSPNGTLTAVIGDATGHGLKAGTVVTATKSLFNAFAENEDISQILRRSGQALKAMKLRGMFMAMAILKIKDNKLVVSIAGMPPMLVFRASTGAVEEIAIRAVPLGGPLVAEYPQRELTLASGDVLVLMSDGFPEMFNDKGEMLGFERAAEMLPDLADRTSQEVIESFITVANDWANGRPQDDDVTFVVIKIKADALQI